MSPETWSLPVVLAAFVAAAAAITGFGVWMTRTAAVLAVRTGLGEALMGALLVGGCTSMAEVVTSVSAALNGYPEIAVSNALGSIAGQTAFLAVADMAYRRANLEHAAAAVENLMLGTLLVGLLAVAALGMALPGLAVGSVHLATPLMLVLYLHGLSMLSRARHRPMWHPRPTPETAPADAGPALRSDLSTATLWWRFALAATPVGIAGWVLAEASFVIADRTVLSQSAVGGVLTGLAGSLPELVTAVTAVRIGKLTLAVGDIVGGNAFDTLIIGVADLFYLPGPIFGHVSPMQPFLAAVGVLLTAILLLGLLRRERHGIANIGTESVAILAIYVGTVGALLVVG